MKPKKGPIGVEKRRVDRRGKISFSEGEGERVDRRGKISFSEGEGE